MIALDAIYADPRTAGKHRNFHYWTRDALAAVSRPERLTGVTGEHAIGVNMLADGFIDEVGIGEVNIEDAAWLASKITSVTMTNGEKGSRGLHTKHTYTW